MTQQPVQKTDNHRTTWERYVSSWRADGAADKRALFDGCLASECVYTDPLTQAVGWDALIAYMDSFHQQVPGGHFVTTHFQDHHDRSIAAWNMVDGAGNVLGHGFSYAEYAPDGRLRSMNGFFETPSA